MDIPRGDVWEPNTWRPWYFGPRNQRGAVVFCENGHGMSIAGNPPFGSEHRIDSNGTVTPSVVCPHEGCSWHVFVRLVGWSQNGEY
jgi:hypothetical protein